MSFESIAKSSRDQELVDRVEAALAKEVWQGSPPPGQFTDVAKQSPVSAVSSMIWPICTASDVEAAYEYAMTSGNEHPGGDPTVITDGMILANVQANWPTTPE